MRSGVIFDNKGSSGNEPENSQPDHKIVNPAILRSEEDQYSEKQEVAANVNAQGLARDIQGQPNSSIQVRSAGENEINSENPRSVEESKENQHTILRKDIFSMLQSYVMGLKNLENDSTPIHVDEIASRVARIYEKIRKIVDWQEDNVLRRRAIERILKRMLFAKISGISVFREVEDANTLSETVTKELIRGGHLPNNEVPREVIPVVSDALSKYLFFLKRSSSPSTPLKDIKRQVNFTTFIIETAACEIEEILASPVREYVLLDAMTDIMEKRIKIVPSNALSQEEKARQIYIATCRTLLDLDSAYITYRLLDFKYSDWGDPESNILDQRFEEVIDFWKNSDKLLNHPLSKDFRRICEQNDTVFTLIGDLLGEMKKSPKKLMSIFENKKSYITKIAEIYDKRYQTLKKRLFRLGVFSTLSVFLSNWFTFFIVEVPMAHIFNEGFSLTTALIDFIIPTIVMFILVIIIRPPAKSNKEIVLNAIASFTYKNEGMKYFEIQASKKERKFLKIIFGILYLFMIWLVFTIIGASFYVAGLPLSSVVFDTFTIALTIFAAVVIRNKSKELNIGDKTSFFEFILDMISVPVAKVGAFLAAKWKEYNVVAIFFNFVVETPFSLVLDTVEGWSQYLKDRKAELD
ncbi:hypothetical protein JXA63_01430 [Candidatus Woesebacteria bacterium]|nr:hypothetical protein [Candidatus Woesebacteria bacterium]